jgi:hypothetical protein
MVSTVTSYTDIRNRALTGEGLDGVVRVVVDGYYGTGVLLYDGHAVLTAAHLFTHSTMATNIAFETVAGNSTVSASAVILHPAFNTTDDNNDLAIVWLASSATLVAQRYNLYRGSDEVGQTFNFAGYGQPGTGATGEMSSYSGKPLRQKASNQFDADIGTVKQTLGSVLSWTPAAGTQLVADFDNGNSTNDAFGRLIGAQGNGLGAIEGLLSPGDSGGPAFIHGAVAGIASYTASLSMGSVHPDVDAVVSNSSFGEIAAWQRVSYYQQWIDQSLRSHYPNAPSSPGAVQKAVVEGNGGTSYAYFLLQFTGVRSDPSQLLSVDYATRDGTATAAQDYIATQGTLVLYPGESQAVIAVEIVGDTTPESDETMYLDVTHPVGGSFGDGVVTLTAVRTIVNDDGAF